MYAVLCRGEFAPDIYADGRPKPPRKLQPQSVAREISAMQAALNWGSRRLMVFGKPTFRFERPNDKELGRVVWLTEVQEEDLRSKLSLREQEPAAVHNHGPHLWRAARRDARFAVRAAGVVCFQLIDFNVPGKRRTRKRRAVVPMTPEVRRHLEVLFQERGPTGHVLKSACTSTSRPSYARSAMSG